MAPEWINIRALTWIAIRALLTALRDCLEQRRCTTDELSEYARVCRVSRVMRPYMEALA